MCAENVFTGDSEVVEEARRLCAKMKTAAKTSLMDAYSIGQTYFIKPHEEPQNLLEKLAQEIFCHHVFGYQKKWGVNGVYGTGRGCAP